MARDTQRGVCGVDEIVGWHSEGVFGGEANFRLGRFN